MKIYKGEDVFSYNIGRTVFLIKLHSNLVSDMGSTFNAVDIADGSVSWISPEAEVKPLEGAFVIDYNNRDKVKE